jgi:hypothetical protein
MLNLKRDLQVMFVKDQVEESNVVIYVGDGADASPDNSTSLYSPFLHILGCSSHVATVCLLSQILFVWGVRGVMDYIMVERRVDDELLQQQDIS